MPGTEVREPGSAPAGSDASTQDVLPLLQAPLLARPLVRLVIAVLLFQLAAARLAAYVAAPSAPSEPTFEQLFANSQRPAQLLPQSAQQIGETARLEALLASKTSAFEGRDDLVPVTAVLLSWKRHRGLDLVLRYIAKHPFVREIIVWNNNVGVFVNRDDIVVRLEAMGLVAVPKIRVVNAPSNLHDLGKHYACALASSEHC